MPAAQISQFMLVNQGLSVRSALGFNTAQINDDAEPPITDVVGAFQKLIVDPRFSASDLNLAGMISTFASPLDLATFFINAKYTELGGSDGVLGRTVSAVAATPNKAGFVRVYQSGSIYWHPQVGAHELHGPIRVRWSELGGEQGFLGFPSSDITRGNDVRSEGMFAHFQGGSIYWAPLPQRITDVASISQQSSALVSADTLQNLSTITQAKATALASNNQLILPTDRQLDAQTRLGSANTGVAAAMSNAAINAQINIGAIKQLLETSAGAFEVHGAIREKYLALGAEASILGYPSTDESSTPDGVGRYNHFQGGSIYWTPGTGAHEVHGLIRDRWASLGWERNSQLGYPITDEFIPDPRVGHRRPEVIKKPIVAVPIGVIKLPAEAIWAGFPSSVVNTPASAETFVPSRARPVAVAATHNTVNTTQSVRSVSGALGMLTDRAAQVTPVASESILLDQGAIAVALDPGFISTIRFPTTQAASTPAEIRSVNRFSDFESGVLFWFRGATSASVLPALAATSDGTSLSFSGADIAAIALSKIGKSSIEAPNAQLTSMTFVGTTGYSFDGAQVHNRRHRVRLILQGIESQSSPGIFGILIPQTVPVTATIELQVEVWFDASQRRIVLAATDWTLLQASSGSYATAISTSLRAKLDPLLWSSYELLTFPDTDAGTPVAVLSVKTLANGAVCVFIEPKNNRLLGSFNELANAVSPSVVLFSQPN